MGLRSRPIVCALEAVVHGPQGSEREEVLEVGGEVAGVGGGSPSSIEKRHLGVPGSKEVELEGVVGPVAKFQVVGLEDGLPVVRCQGSDGSVYGDKIELVVFSADGLRVDVSALVSSGVLEGKKIVVPLLPSDGAADSEEVVRKCVEEEEVTAKIRGAHSKVYEWYFGEGRLLGIEVDGASGVPFEQPGRQPGRPKKARRGRGAAIGSGRGDATSSGRGTGSSRGPIGGGSTAKNGCV